MESNQRYYSRRAVEERMAARRAVTEQAREWHSKLAADFAERATACTAPRVWINAGQRGLLLSLPPESALRALTAKALPLIA